MSNVVNLDNYRMKKQMEKFFGKDWTSMKFRKSPVTYRTTTDPIIVKDLMDFYKLLGRR